ncbi:Bifunctional protein GlmU [Nymphon striatum]|nr:Bifunctional protein GlmU [Nymphon striatum]
MKDARANADVVVLGFDAADPARYGRLITDGDTLLRIVEFKDASDDERAVTLCNSGVVMADSKTLFDLISKVGNDNASGEYYLTDIVGLANDAGLRAAAVTCAESETMGVNFPCRSGRGRGDVPIQRPRRGIGKRHHPVRGAIVGPYARLRPGAELSENTHVGNFVEIKNATLAEGAKANHLTYIGDADVGARTNIGAGTITCNYDGVMKHRTTIGSDAFIGSNTMLVAPVTVGQEAMTATSTVVTENVPDGALAIARARQSNKPMLAVKLMDMLRAKKKKRDQEAG